MKINERIIHLPKRSLSEKYWFAVDQPKDKTEGRLKIADLISYIESNIDISSTVTFTLDHTATDYDKFVTYDSTGEVLYYRTGSEIVSDLDLDTYYLRLDGTNDPVTGNITYSDDVYQYFGTASNGGYVYSTTLGGGTLATVFGANVVSEINASHYYLNDEAGNLKIELNSSQAVGQKVWFHDSVYIGGALVASGSLTAGIANASSEYGKFLVTNTGTVEYRTTTEVLADLGLTDLATMFSLDVSDTINALYPLNIASLRILPDSGVVTIASQGVTSDSNYGDDIAIQFVLGGFKAKLGTYADGAGGTYSNYFNFDTATLSTVKSIQFDITGLSHTHSEGSIWWSDDDKTLNLDTEVTDTVIQVGQETVLRATNKTGSPLVNGSIVYINGAQAYRPTITLANASAAATSKVCGMVTSDIADNATGYVTVFGLVRDIDTSAFTAGDFLYLSTSSSGAFVNVEPVAPNYRMRIGTVVYSHATEGIILFKSADPLAISANADVNGTTPSATNKFFVWDNINSYWDASIIDATDITNFNTEVSNNTDVAANTTAKHAALTIGTANGLSLATQALSLALSSTSTTGALSDTDWDTFNDKAQIASPTFTGTVTTPIIKITTGAASGYYLQSDAAGIASWAAIASAYQGTWNANTNTPTLADGVGSAGDWYRCVVAGTTDFGSGNITFAIGDDAYYNGSTWEKVPGQGYVLQTASATVLGGIKIGFGITMTGDIASITDIPNLTGPITSSGVATSITSQTGTGTTFVMNTSPTITTPTIASFTNATHDHADATGGGVLSTSNITELTNLYYTDERVDDRAAALIQNGTGLTWTYIDAAGTLTGNVSLTTFDTDDLSEGLTNLYYTQVRFDSAFAAKDTDDLLEGSSNLYYTDARVVTKIVSMGTTNYVPIFSAAGLADSVINQSTSKIIITGTLGVGIDPASWATWITGSTRIDNSLTIYSDEVGKTNYKMLIDASDGDNLRIYSYDDGGAAFLPIIIGGAADATSGLTIALDAIDAGLDASGFVIDGNLRATIANTTTDTNKFIVDDSGELKYRTATEILSDLGITDTAAMFTLGSDDVIYPLYSFGIASLYILPDTGSLTIANMDVTSDSDYGDQHNYKFTIAGNSLIDIGLYADGAGGYYGKYINLNTDTVVSDTLTISSIANAVTDLDKFLVSNSGVVEYRTGAEVLSDIGAQATLSPSALTKVDDTNITLTLGGTPTTALLEAVSLTLGWTGILSVARGGTNSGSVLANDKVMVSNTGSIIESPTVTVTELSLLNGIISMSTGAADNDKFVSQGYVDDAVTPYALTKVNDTNVTLTLGGSHTTALLNAASLTLGWVGTLADGRITSSTSWNTAYTHSQLVSGNPHSVTQTEIGLGSVENTALSTWSGSSNITTLGTISAGINIVTGQTYKINSITIITASTSFDDTNDVLGASMKAIKDYGDANWDGGSGTVTSVAMSTPTGLSISGSPITTSGTLALTYTAGYSIPTDSSQTSWDSKQDALTFGIAFGNVSKIVSASVNSGEYSRFTASGLEGRTTAEVLADLVTVGNTAFNKDFGTTSVTVAYGNHNHAGIYEPAFSKNTAFNKNFGTTGTTVAYGNHTHSAYAPLASGAYHTEFIKITNSTLGNTCFYIQPHVSQVGNMITVRNKANSADVFAIYPSDLVKFRYGVSINEFSSDGTMAGNSDLAVPTEKAVKTYVDASAGFSSGDAHTWTADQSYNDDVKLIIGTTGDMEIFYNGTGGYTKIDMTLGDLQIDGSSGNSVIIQNNGVDVVDVQAGTVYIKALLRVGDAAGDVLAIKETTYTSTSADGWGKIYPKTDNKLYFRDGAGVEHEIAFV